MMQEKKNLPLKDFCRQIQLEIIPIRGFILYTQLILGFPEKLQNYLFINSRVSWELQNKLIIY